MERRRDASLCHPKSCAFRPLLTLGPSFHIKSAAQALHPHHPDYYFVIDRDHHEDVVVEASWSNFPNPATDNLLIWRKRELENYFLEPGYLSQSAFLTKSDVSKLTARLLKLAEGRVFFDLANQTIANVREVLKSKWIEDFTNPEKFNTADSALSQLRGCTKFKDRKLFASAQLEFSSIEENFRKMEAEYLGSSKKPEFGEGQWLERMRGKQLLATLVNECFEVKDSDGKRMTGRDAVTTVAEELLSKNIEEQPPDFQELRKLIQRRIQ